IHKDHEAMREKTLQAKQYAEKALKVDPNHPAANQWMAECLGQLAQLEVTNPDACIPLVYPLVNHLAVAVKAQPDSWRVLLLESKLQMTLHENPKAMQNYASRLPPNLVLQELPTIEGKLRRVIEQNPYSHEAFARLTSALYLQGKFAEAMQIGQQGLALERLNRGEQHAAD